LIPAGENMCLCLRITFIFRIPVGARAIAVARF
jgi:hypothetical protein